MPYYQWKTRFLRQNILFCMLFQPKNKKSFQTRVHRRYHLPIMVRGYVTVRSENGAAINTLVYIVNSFKELSLLGEADAVRLGIVTNQLKGSV